MVARISVRVDGSDGLEDLEQLREALAADTGLTWLQVEPEGDRPESLSGVVEIFLVAIVARAGEMTLEYTLEKVREAIRRFKAEYLDPPEVTVVVEPAALPGPAPDAPLAADPADDPADATPAGS